ncbi:uncharacterized protein [Littorina saxatilis]|uniref:uncharacterized protein isoform X2 n=1 Tax=Littorina saxatilis TaxID=31220 RepID=UPI0038B51040
MTMTVMAARHVTGRGRVLRVAVVGDKQVGKTSLVTRYSHDVFSPHYTYTQGGDLENVVVTINDKNVHVTIVDAAGHRYVRSLIKTLYRDVQGILVVYDVTRRATFDSVQEWIRQIELVNTSSPVIFVVGNKQDLTSHRCVPEEEAQFRAVLRDERQVRTQCDRDVLCPAASSLATHHA